MNFQEEKKMFNKVTLLGKKVRLEPLSTSHIEGLVHAISDGELWKLFVTIVPPTKEIDSFIQNAEDAHKGGDGLAFAIIDNESGKVVGSTRFMKANLPYKRVEIGFTFLAKSHQKTATNSEAKLLLLTHAFETLKLNRVELLTDYLNNRSRNAILRLGAKQEGILRSHMVMPNGRVRDSVIFSITAYDWPGVKENLEYKLQQ